MKRILPLFAVLGLGGLVIGAAVADSNPASEARNVSAFHAIDVAGTLQVEVTIGKPASVQIRGEADLVGKVTTTVVDGVLVIDTPDLDGNRHGKRHNKRDNHLRAIITAPDLTSLTVSGTGGLSIAGVANDNFAISIPGTGAVSATGSTGSLRIHVDGTGQVTANDLAAKTATVTLKGTGSVKLRASESLDARITGTGAIDVYGRPPQIKKSVTGTGNIRLR